MSKRAASLPATLWVIGLGAALLGSVGCAKNGLGATVRTDISTRMTTAQPSITTCYGDALKRSRKLRGVIVLSVTAMAKTGQFSNVTVTRDELGDEGLRKCVVDEVAKLTLETPQKTNITFSYPLRFAPSN